MPRGAEPFVTRGAETHDGEAASSRAAALDLIVIGAGAAGLALALFAARRAPSLRVACLDGAKRIGAKILISGGSRCNVTNRVVTEADFWGGSSRFVRTVLRSFPAHRSVEFFRELGVTLHEEEDGKLFPDSNTSRTVLQALLRECEERGVEIRSGERVCGVERGPDGFTVVAEGKRPLRARAVALCTGGRSLPKTGSDGFGYELARRFGHTCVDTVPALAPLVFDGWQALSGVAHPAAMTLRADGARGVTLSGALLWTHFGASGPVALNMSRHWHRATSDEQACDVLLNVCPGESFESVDAWLRDQRERRPRARAATVLAARVPAAVAEALVRVAGITEDATLAHLTRAERHALAAALTRTPLPIRGSRGYGYAEVTAGGVSLDEVDPSTLQSRLCDGLFFAGEILDVDGRLGGFNFQWAWSSAWVAGQAAARTLRA